MVVLRLFHAFVQCAGLLFVFSDIMCVALTMTASEDADSSLHSLELRDKIDIFKKDILNRLGYEQPPNVTHVTRSIEEKRRMIQEYRRYMEEERMSYRDQYEDAYDEGDETDKKVLSKTFYSLDYKGETPLSIRSEDWARQEAVRLYFSTFLSHPEEDHTRELFVHSAKLKVFIKEVRPENVKDQFTVDYQIRLNAYQILAIENSTSYKRTLLDSLLVPLTSSGFVNFEIGKAVQNWINDKNSNLGIEIAAESQDLNEVVTLDLNHSKNETTGFNRKSQPKTAPSVKLYVQERDILKRVKRHSNDRNICRKGKKECCRHPIKISFRDIQWDNWIVAPQDYLGYYCAGTCPANHKLASTFSAIKAMLHTINPNTVPAPCCHATKFSPLMILHYDGDGKYTFSKFPELVVEQCRCG